MFEWLKKFIISILTFFLSLVGMKVEDVLPAALTAVLYSNDSDESEENQEQDQEQEQEQEQEKEQEQKQEQ
jgi:hypothetical protein